MRNYVRSDRADRWDPAAYEQARIAARLTFAQVAEIVGVSLSTAHRWAEKAPAAALVPAIARALGVPQKALLRRKGA